MSSRAMIIVAGGTSTRFGSDKLTAPMAGVTLIEMTVARVAPHVDRVVVATRTELHGLVTAVSANVTAVPGGPSRTQSESAGIAAISSEYDLVGIHDAARPLVSGRLIDELFTVAERSGGAIPVLPPLTPLVDKETLRVRPHLLAAQTPQVFAGRALEDAYARAIEAGVEGKDTADVVLRFVEDLRIEPVPGDDQNLKVTYPADLDEVRRLLEGPSRNGTP